MEQRSFGDILKKALFREVAEEETRERLRSLGYEGTWMDLLSQAQVERAARGDTAAFRLLRDTLDQTEERNMAQTAQLPDLRQLSDEELRRLLAEAEAAP